MHLTAVALTPGGDAQSATGVHTIVSPAGDAPRRFELPLFLRIATDGADSIVVDTAQARLQGAFLPLDYDALHPPHPSLMASLADLGDEVTVTFDAPRRLRTVRLGPNRPAGGVAIDVCRLDGNAISQKPTVSANLQSGTATLPDTVELTDLRLALRLRKANGDPVGLNPTHIAELGVRAYPATPRLGVLAAQELDIRDGGFAPATFVTFPGEAGKTASTSHFDFGAAFATELNRHIAALRAQHPDVPLPNPIDVALVFASDAPCRLDIGAFAFVAYLVRDAFTPPADKLTLRFNGAGSEPQSVVITLPPGATVHHAFLRAVESFGRDRLPTEMGEESQFGTPGGTSGVLLDTSRWAVQQIASAEAITTTGVALALLPLARNCSLRIDIQEDWQGSPSGETVLGGVIDLDRIGSPRWATLALDGAVTLPSRPHWLMVRASKGQATWLTRPGNARLAVRENAYLIPLSGHEALYRFIVPATIQQSVTTVSHLTIGASVLTPLPNDEDDMRFDLTEALNAVLAKQSTELSSISIPVSVAAALRGLVTLYPPYIEYEL